MTASAKENPTSGCNRAQGDTTKEQSKPSASLAVFARARQQARATGKAKIGKCIVAETVQRTDQAPTNPVDLITRLRVREVEAVIRARHGDVVPDARDTDDLEIVEGYVLAIAGSRGEIEGWVRRWLPWFDDTAVLESAHKLAAKLSAATRGPAVLKADAIARLIGVTLAERTRLGLCTIGACDVDRKDRRKLARERKREQDRKRQSRKRTAAGRKPRDQFLAESTAADRPWEREGISRRTWYRRRNDTGVSRLEELRSSYIPTGDQPVPTSQEFRAAEAGSIIPCHAMALSPANSSHSNDQDESPRRSRRRGPGIIPRPESQEAEPFGAIDRRCA